MTAQPTRPRHPSRKEVEEALADLDFPLDKEDLVRCVSDQSSESGSVVLRQLRALPLGTYDNVEEVLRSIDLADQLGP